MISEGSYCLTIYSKDYSMRISKRISYTLLEVMQFNSASFLALRFFYIIVIIRCTKKDFKIKVDHQWTLAPLTSLELDELMGGTKVQPMETRVSP